MGKWNFLNYNLYLFIIGRLYQAWISYPLDSEYSKLHVTLSILQ